MSAVTVDGVAREARRTALILAAAQAVLGSGAPICFALGALAGNFMLGADKSLATAPLTGFNIGVALGALPAAAIIRALGHRNGFMTGTLLTAFGGLVATVALFQSSFWLFAFGLLVVGGGNAFIQQFRFAAADNAPAAFKARAISFVLAGGIVTAVLGPQTVIFTHDLLAPVPFAGSFAAIIVLAAIGAAILLFLRKESRIETAQAASHAGRPLREIVSQPRYAVALGCGVAGYALMTFVMTGAPLAMVGCGFSSDQATLGISWHVMAILHRPPDPSLRRAGHRGERLRPADRLRRRGHVGHSALAVLDGADPARPRLEFLFHRRDRDRLAMLHARGEGQGARVPRFRAVLVRRLRLAHVGRCLQWLGLGRSGENHRAGGRPRAARNRLPAPLRQTPRGPVSAGRGRKTPPSHPFGRKPGKNRSIA
jgi:hypothetical protein